MTYDKGQYKAYWRDRASELKSINHKIWGFVGAAAMIDFGAKLLHDGKSEGKDYKSFVRDNLDDKYKKFAYKDGKQDLDVQMWHILRCGILHAFTLSADERGDKAGARDGSIVIASLDDKCEPKHNVTPWTEDGKDACLLVLEPFVDDIWKAVETIFDSGTYDASINKCYDENPPFTTFLSAK